VDSHTVVCKIAEGKAPVPDDQSTDFLIGANSWDALRKLFRGQAQSVNAAVVDLPDGAQQAVFAARHGTAGVMALISDFVTTLEAQAATGENPFAIPSAIIGVIGAVSSGAADFLVPKAPVKNEAISTLGKVTMTLTFLSKILFSGSVEEKLGDVSAFEQMLPEDGRITWAIVNMVLVLPAFLVTVCHFAELAEAPAGTDRSAAIVGEVSNLASYISCTAYTMAVNDEDEESKQVIIIVAVANVAVAGLQTAEAAID